MREAGIRGTVVGLIVALAGGTVAGGMGAAALAQPAPAVDWSGFYVSGFAGATNGHSNATMTTGVLQYLDATDARQIGRLGNNDMEQWRPSGALAGGYARQFGNILVGLEASANTLLLDEVHSVNDRVESVNNGSRMTIEQSVKANWMATLRPRLGWAQDNWLGYLTGGVAATRLQLDASYIDNAFNGLSKTSKEHFVTGWSLGFGGEYALSRDWAFRGEYLYTRFGEVKSVSPVTSTNNSGGTMNHVADLDVQSLFIGFTYRFN
ncbi:outer membrane protein [Ferrovibrio sp.]|uniref:outer membrane protein n=1 Tax=Ferrovibrio sp. TaxID=1917215 RepID=UPI0035B47B2C